VLDLFGLLAAWIASAALVFLAASLFNIQVLFVGLKGGEQTKQADLNTQARLSRDETN
jgi:hypothetical protein